MSAALSFEVAAGLVVMLFGGFVSWAVNEIRTSIQDATKRWDRTHRLARDNADVLEAHGLLERSPVDHVREEERADREELIAALVGGEIDPEEVEIPTDEG